VGRYLLRLLQPLGSAGAPDNGLRSQTVNDTEGRWLEYAWGVVNCPDDHRRACEGGGAAVAGPGRYDGNELRFPGYLGRGYCEGRGVLCVGAVHREADPDALEPQHAQLDAELVAAHRDWLASERGLAADARFLSRLRVAYEGSLPFWPRWRRHFRPLVEVYLGMDPTEIAWTNLAKCRVAIHLGSRQRSAESRLTRLCQGAFPVSAVVEAIRPVAVLVAVLAARPGSGIVSSWSSDSCQPLVYTWQGQSGHDRHNTDPDRRPFSEWAPEAAAQIRSAFST
jgi:hypothetical protein